MLDSLVGQPEQFIHLFTREWRTFGGALNFDEPAVAGADDVHVHFGARIFVVFQIKQRRPVNYSDAYGRNFAVDGRSLDLLFFHKPLARNRVSDIRAGDGRGASATVGLQDIAIESDCAFAEHAAIRNRAQAAANQPLNLVSPS